MESYRPILVKQGQTVCKRKLHTCSSHSGMIIQCVNSEHQACGFVHEHQEHQVAYSENTTVYTCNNTTDKATSQCTVRGTPRTIQTFGSVLQSLFVILRSLLIGSTNLE